MAVPGDDDGVGTLLDDLTLAEKLSLVRGTADPAGKATGYVPGVDRFDLPPISLVDGPMGVRDGEATAFPATIALGATWDITLARRVGRAIAREARNKGHDVLLAPGINLVRVPTAGRNFEYVGEDPQLTGAVGAAYVEGVQSAGVVATPKHYVANNQETNRNRVSVEVDERTLRELYLPPFERAVAADAGAVMAAYNRVGGDHMTAHDRLLTDVLKGEFGFDGPVVSDWWATHDAAGALEAGLDLEMPGVTVLAWFAPNSRLLRLVDAIGVSRRLGLRPTIARRFYERFLANPGGPNPFEAGHFGDPLRRAIESGDLAETVLDDAVARVLELHRHVDRIAPDEPTPATAPASTEHAELAREVARRGTVLLENDGVLPIDVDAAIALVGPNADRAKVGGGGSSEVDPSAIVAPLDGLRERTRGPITFERGLPRIREPSMFQLPWQRSLSGLGPGPSFDDAVGAGEAAEVAVVVVQDAGTESEDRDGMVLPGEQDRLVEAVAAVAPHTIVVARTSGPVAMPWVDDVNAVVATWYPGQCEGDALADVLFGTDPGGHLPVTFGTRFADYPVADERRFPGVDGVVHYDEGVFVGYRHFDRAAVEPLFPFGHGLSYADFAFGDVGVDTSDERLTATVPVRNWSERPGRTVVQVYVEAPESPVPRPPRELAGFSPVELAAGESTTVTMSLSERAFARFDSDEAGWVVDPGEYAIAVGTSSRDVRARTTIER